MPTIADGLLANEKVGPHPTIVNASYHRFGSRLPAAEQGEIWMDFNLAALAISHGVLADNAAAGHRNGVIGGTFEIELYSAGVISGTVCLDPYKWDERFPNTDRAGVIQRNVGHAAIGRNLGSPTAERAAHDTAAGLVRESTQPHLGNQIGCQACHRDLGAMAVIGSTGNDRFRSASRV